MTTTTHREAIVKLRGNLDDVSRSEIAQTFRGLETCHTVTIDLTDVESVDSSLLAELVLLKRRCVIREEPPAIELRCDRRVARLLRVSGLDALFDMHCA